VVELAMARTSTFDKRRLTDAFWLGTEARWPRPASVEHYDRMDEPAVLAPP
jgi:hypothetical protein